MVVLEKARLQEVFGKADGLRDTIYTIADIEIHPSSVYVFVADVVGDELGSFAGEYTVKHKFAKIEGGGFSSSIAGVDDLVSHDGDVCEIRISFLGAKLAYYFRDGDTFAAIAWDICKVDDAKSVVAFDTLTSAGWSFTNALV